MIGPGALSTYHRIYPTGTIRGAQGASRREWLERPLGH